MANLADGFAVVAESLKALAGWIKDRWRRKAQADRDESEAIHKEVQDAELTGDPSAASPVPPELPPVPALPESAAPRPSPPALPPAAPPNSPLPAGPALPEPAAPRPGPPPIPLLDPLDGGHR